MTHVELPAQAANILRTVEDGHACNSTSVQSLKLLLLPVASTIKKDSTARVPARSKDPKSAATQSKGAISRVRKQPVLEVHDGREAENPDGLKPHERLLLATQIVNVTLKALTTAIKTARTPQTPSPESKALAKPNSTVPKSDLETQTAGHAPLQQICVNRVLQSPAKSKAIRRASLESSEDVNGIRFQAECSRIGLACLRSLQATEALKARFSPLQLENGMSALIAKLLTLGYDELAVSELRILKRRIEALISNSNIAPSKVPSDPRKEKLKDDTNVQKDLLPELLKFDTTDVSGPLLGLITTSQIQVLKILGLKNHGFSIEAVLKHLRVESDHAPSKLIEWQINKHEPKTRINAAHQLEALAQTIMRLCPSASRASDEHSKSRSCPSAQATLELQSLALQIRTRWWALSGHQPDINQEVLVPFTRYLNAFERRCRIDVNDKYSIAKTAFNSVSKTFGSLETPFQSTSVDILKNLAKQADAAGRVDEAVQWTERGLKTLETIEDPRLQRCAFSCRLAMYQLRERGNHLNSSQKLKSLQDAIAGIEGDLSGESVDLDELVHAVAELRKVAFSLVHGNANAFNASQLIHPTTILGQCVQVVLSSIRFLSRYTGKEPASDATEAKPVRYNQRSLMAKQALPSSIASITAIARLSLKSSLEEWQKLDMVFQEAFELSTRLDAGPGSLQEKKTTGDGNSSPHVSVSSIYLLRFIAQKKIPVDAKILVHTVRKAVNLLEKRPSSEKAQGCFLTKVEKYASLCENLQDYKASAESYKKAIEFLIDSGGIAFFADAAKLIAWPSAMSRNCEFEQTSKIFRAFAKVMLKINPPSAGSRMFFDAEWLPNDQRGLILELQLTSLISLLLDRGSTQIIWEQLQDLCELIMSLYEGECFVERRLHVCVQLQHLFAVLHMTPQDPSLSKVLEAAETGVHKSPMFCSKSPRPYIRHLTSRMQLYRNLKTSSDSSTFETVLVDWWNLAQSWTDRQALETHVYDISGWLQQLEVVAEHLYIEEYEGLRTTVLSLIVKTREAASSMLCMDLASSLTDLGIHYARIGYSGLGGLTLQRAQRFLDIPDVSFKFILQWCVANAEFGLLCGNVEQCGAFFEQGMETLQSLRLSAQTSSSDRMMFAQAAADLNFIQSRVLSEQGHSEKALLAARAASQEYYRIWASFSRRMGLKTNSLVATASMLSKDENKPGSDTDSRYAALRMLQSWYLSPSLFAVTLHLSRCFAHTGLLLEAQHYLEECQKIADAVQSSALTRTCLATRAEYAVCSGETEQSLTMLRDVETAISNLSCTYGNVNIHASLALHYMKANQIKAGSAACDESIRRLQSLTLKSVPDRLLHAPSHTESLALLMADMNIDKGGGAQAKKVRVARNRAPKTPSVKQRTEACSRDEGLPTADVIPLQRLKGEVLRHSALAELSQSSFDPAMALLDEAATLPPAQSDLIMDGLLRSQVHLGQTLQRLLVDPVFSVLPESTICCPAIVLAAEPQPLPKASTKLSTSTKSARGKPLNKRAVQKEPSAPQDCLGHLHVARRCLTEVFSTAKKTASTSTIHTISNTLSKILTMLSVVPSTHDDLFASSQFLAYTMELGRQFAMDRESSSIRVESLVSGSRDTGMLLELPEPAHGDHLQHYDLDFSIFQTNYLDIIPKPWTVISITLSKSNEEMWISKMRAGQTPFILRVPFNRENASENDDEGLTFDEGRAEMLNIIQLANTSAHDTGDLSQKGAKKKWWDTRATLDTRLKDLLINIESIWLGGFRGMLSSAMPEPSLLARFEQSLQYILNKHLPSRQASAKVRPTNQIRLDSRILELFVGLGPPTEENDVDEQLMDLLYFVVDILQFHEERNAYDEIDFDAIVVETADALRQYHQAADTSDMITEKQHTILILDRNLHCFPWESIPCMAGQPVSRLPSLGCLRRRILQMRDEQKEQDTVLLNGTRVNPGRGSYMLNPAGDLKNTQAAFEEPLRELSKWDGFVNREPSEAEMKSCLQDNKIFLYFGHGSGGQYIRQRTIKKLDQCAVALLMGCSSGALTQAGEYEAYGTPISYMHAGCPALLATLWDVTDKDIDRFSDDVLRRWGLFKEKPAVQMASAVKHSVKSKGKAKAKIDQVVIEPSSAPVSLDDAVAKSRDSCILKYLNGAAPVVYGIPVYIG